MEYKVSLEKFSGPLDLLLSLIEEKKLAISEISLSQVTDQFLKYLKKAEDDIELAANISGIEYQRIVADFLVIASRLILIKSRSLLPNLVLSQDEEQDIKDLEERLKIYQQIKMAGRELGKWAKGQSPYFSRESYFNLPAMFYPPKNISSEAILTIYQAFLKTLPQIEKLEEQSLERIVTMEEKIKELTDRISMAVEASFAEISKSVKAKIDVILTFLAMLMLFRNKTFEVSQDKLFGDIKIKKVNST